MLTSSRSITDPARLAALARTGLIGSPSEPRFERLARLAAALLDAPVALVSLLDDVRQFLKAGTGLPEPWRTTREMPLRLSMCQLVVEASAPLAIGDARVHPLVRDHDAVGELGVVAYVGTPIVDPGGHILGTICVIDTTARVWSERDLDILAKLAAAVSSEIAAGPTVAGVEGDDGGALSCRAVLDGFGEVLFRTDLQGRWTWLTSPWEQLVGRTAAASLGTFSSDLVSMEDRALHMQQMREIASGERQACTMLTRVRRDDGRASWVEMRARADVDASGAIVGIVGTLDDVTERVEAENAQHEATEHLLLSQKMEAVARMAAGIAHDFNNILAAVSGYADLLSTSPGIDDEARRDAGEIIAAIDRGRRLTTQLLAFGRRKPRTLEPLDLNSIIPGVARMLSPMLSQRITLDLVLADDLPLVTGDRSQLDQLVVNLLLNARDATTESGVIGVRTGVELRAGREHVCLTVTDTGAGMDDATRARIFEPFFSTRKSEGATGLGLATVQDIVVQARGRIEVETSLGHGSEFRVFLPALARG